jgi:hypothetical protein
LEAIRSWFISVAVTAGVDVVIPDGSGCPRRDALAAVETATSAIRFRFGAAGLSGAVTPDQVAVAASGGRLLTPSWPPRGAGRPQHQSPLTLEPADRRSSPRRLPGNGFGQEPSIGEENLRRCRRKSTSAASGLKRSGCSAIS